MTPAQSQDGHTTKMKVSSQSFRYMCGGWWHYVKFSQYYKVIVPVIFTCIQAARLENKVLFHFFPLKNIEK